MWPKQGLVEECPDAPDNNDVQFCLKTYYHNLVWLLFKPLLVSPELLRTTTGKLGFKGIYSVRVSFSLSKRVYSSDCQPSSCAVQRYFTQDWNARGHAPLQGWYFATPTTLSPSHFWKIKGINWSTFQIWSCDQREFESHPANLGCTLYTKGSYGSWTWNLDNGPISKHKVYMSPDNKYLSEF